MENAASPTKNQLNSSGRNVLKELNNFDGVIKSPKQLSKDESAIKESSNLLKNIPDIISNVGADEDIIHSIPLQVAPNTDVIVDVTSVDTRDTTFNANAKEGDVNNTIDYVSAVLDETIYILGKQIPIESITQNRTDDNETVTVCSVQNLNCGFADVTESSIRNLETNHGHNSSTNSNIRNENPDQAIGQTQSDNVKLLALPNQSAFLDASGSTSLIGDIRSAARTNIDTEADTQFLDDQKQENTSLSATASSNRLNETVDIVLNETVDIMPNETVDIVPNETVDIVTNQTINIVPNETVDIVPHADLQQKEPTDFTIEKVNAEVVPFDVSSSVNPRNDQLVNNADDQTIIQNQSGDIQQSIKSIQVSSGNITISESNINNAASNDISEVGVQSKDKLFPTIQDSKIESIKLNETVNKVAAVDHQLVESKSTHDNQEGVESTVAPSIPYENFPFVANITSDLEGYVPVVTHINDPTDVDDSRNDSKAAVEMKNLSETNSPKEEVGDATFCQESTFVLTDKPSDNSIVLISNSDQKTEVVASNENYHQNTEMSALKQFEKIREFENNQTISVDSLDAHSETRDCSLDSIEMKKPFQHQAVLQSDEIVTSGNTDKIMVEKDVPAISETMANSEHSLNESNEPPICDHLLPLDSPIHKMPIESEVPLMSANIRNVNQSHFVFKSPLIPNSTLAKMDNQHFQGGDSDFMVLNSSDFDFLQSRGSSSVDPEDDRRSSLLLRFDPLVKSRSSIIPFTPAVQRVEESAEVEQGLNHIEQLVDLCSNTSVEKNSDEQIISTAKPPTTNEPAMSIGLVQNSNSMDNEAEAYVNNIKSDRTEDKHMQIDGVPLTDKKIKFKHTDEDIQKRMEEYEATQEILLKRLSEKDKAIVKTSSVLELYEKAIAEVLAAKEKLAQTYEKTHEELKTDRDLNFQHLLSLESTFSDLHMKFERNIQYTTQLQEKLNALEEEKAKSEDSLAQQETRYDKLTGHALQQFDIANAKLEQQTKIFSADNTKLKALIKREEIYKNAVQEELLQKKRENEELVKICDELISGQKS